VQTIIAIVGEMPQSQVQTRTETHEKSNCEEQCRLPHQRLQGHAQNCGLNPLLSMT
jgi:hypothetical protein